MQGERKAELHRVGSHLLNLTVFLATIWLAIYWQLHSLFWVCIAACVLQTIWIVEYLWKLIRER